MYVYFANSFLLAEEVTHRMRAEVVCSVTVYVLEERKDLSSEEWTLH